MVGVREYDIIHNYILLDLIFPDLQRLLDVKEAEIARSCAEIGVLKSQVEDKGDIITVKQR